MYPASFKDCLVGQVRRSHIIENSELTATTFPPHFNIIKQQGITWDNKTGMNPWWNSKVVKDTINESYGEMFVQGHTIKSPLFTNHSPVGLTREEYDELLLYNNHFFSSQISKVCFTHAYWYLVDKILKLPDALEYDYTIIRQYDTVLTHTATEEQITFIFEDLEEKMVGKKYKNRTIPLVFVQSIISHYSKNWQRVDFPFTASVGSNYFIFNRAAVRKLQNIFFHLMASELIFMSEYCHDNSKFVLGQPGSLLTTVLIKNNIFPINIAQYRLQQPFYVRLGINSVPSCDFSRRDRINQ